MTIVYADSNATTPVAREVMEAMKPYFADEFYNPSAISGRAYRIDSTIAKARRTVAEFLGTSDTKEIVFTSCATESNNWATVGTTRANPEHRHIITSQVEHPSILRSVQVAV